MAETKTAAEVAFDAFIESGALKYEKAAARLLRLPRKTAIAISQLS